MNDNQRSYEQAEAARKNKEYEKASELFSTLWQQNGSSMVGWRLVFCLRKLGRFQEAEEIARAALIRFPHDTYTQSELSWVIYDREIKVIKVDVDLGRLVHFAKEMLSLNTEDLAHRRVTNAVVKVAKAKDNWEVVLEWTGKITPEILSSEEREINGKRGMSERETWYIGRSRAMLELGQYAEARALAQTGMKEFSRKPFLARIAALATAKMGQLDVAIEELTALLGNPIAGWYIKADLAGLEYERGNYHVAYSFMCEALSGWQDVKFKISDIVILGRIAQKLGRFDVAITHVALAKAIRIANNWPIPEDLQDFEQEIRKAIATSGKEVKPIPSDLRSLKTICNAIWKEGDHEQVGQTEAKQGEAKQVETIHLPAEHIEGVHKEANPNTPELLTGTLGKVYPNSSYAFIERDDGGGGVFVFIKDIPSAGVLEGAHLKFTLKQGFSQKKKDKAIQAANVHLIKS